MQQSTGQQPVIDSNLLSHIQTLTSQLLNKKPPEPGFNKVDKQFLPPKKILLYMPIGMIGDILFIRAVLLIHTWYPGLAL